MTCLTSSISSTCSSTNSDNVLCSSLLASFRNSCNSCGTSTTSRCLACNHCFCDLCLNEHHTKVHNNVIQASTTSSPPSPSLESGSSCPTFCDIHREPHVGFCVSCGEKTLCSCCLFESHIAHNVTITRGRDLRAGINQIRNEIEHASMNVTRAMNSTRTMTTRVKFRSQVVAGQIKTAFDQLQYELIQCKDALLKEVCDIESFKLYNLFSQLQEQHKSQVQLAMIMKVLDSSMGNGDVELLAANETVKPELDIIRRIKSDVYPCEDDYILFQLNFNSAMFANMGRILTSRTKEVPPIAPPRLALPPCETITKPLSRIELCRPIYGCKEPVVLKKACSPSLIFGTSGENDGELSRPWGICCNNLGHFIVADRSNNRIQVFDSEGRFLYKFGKEGEGVGEMKRPAGVAINPDNHIVVADKDNHRIQIFKMDGTFIMMFGSRGLNEGQFTYPWDVACNSQGQILVSDSRAHRIQVFSPTGKFICKYGCETKSSAWKHFDNPRSVCFKPDGDVVVSDFNNHRVVLLSKDLRKVEYWGEMEGKEQGKFSRPQGVVIDDWGHIIVCDSKNNRIQVFHGSRKFMYEFGKHGSGPGQFEKPQGVCITPGGKIAVVDFGGDRVQVF